MNIGNKITNVFLFLTILLTFIFMSATISHAKEMVKQRGDKSKWAKTAHAKINVFKGNGKTIYLLGTVHFHHLRNPNYTWPHFDKIFSLISPELLLVEIRPEHFNPEEYLDGPLEMAYLVNLALTKKIESKGINWAPDEWLFDFSKIDWDRRNDEQVQLILNALRETNAKVILVAIGAKNIDGIISRLTKKGYSKIESPQWDLTVDDYSDIPETVIIMWKQGLKYLSQHPTAKTFKIQKTIKFLKEAIQSKGYKFKRN